MRVAVPALRAGGAARVDLVLHAVAVVGLEIRGPLAIFFLNWVVYDFALVRERIAVSSSSVLTAFPL